MDILFLLVLFALLGQILFFTEHGITKLLIFPLLIGAWFAWFDLNGDGVLQRTELAALLKHVSGIDPSDEALDMALADARAADIKAGRGRMVPQPLTLHVPEAAAPGQVIQVGLPGGGTTAVTVPADAVPGQSFKFTFECMQLDGVSKNAAFAVVTKFSVRLAASSTSQPASR